MDDPFDPPAAPPRTDPATGFADRIRRHYEDLLGRVPPGLAIRARVARSAGRDDAIEAIEHLREALLHRNPLDRRTQQLVHFGMLVALRAREPAALHAAGAVKAGATLADLHGVAETAAVVAGMPAFGLAIELIAALAPSTEGAASPSSTSPHDSPLPSP